MWIVLALCLLPLAAAKIGEIKYDPSQYKNWTGLAAGLPFSMDFLQVGTWNMALVDPNMDISEEIDAIPKHFSVLALQEVWSPQAAQQITKKLSKHYPYSYFHTPSTPKDNGCAPYVPPEYCYQVTGMNSSDCVAALAYGLLQCITATCQECQCCHLRTITVDQVLTMPTCQPLAGALLVLNPQCGTCLLNEALQTDGNIDVTWSTCMAQAGARYWLDGSLGLLVLSKQPMTQIHVREVPSFGTKRGIIYAHIGGLKYAFSHFPYDFGFPPPIVIPGFLQPEMATEMILSEADVLVGDFNSGTDYQPAAYNALLDRYQDLAPGALTYCTAHMLSVQDPRCCLPGGFCYFPMSLDHVLLHRRWTPLLQGNTLFAASKKDASKPLSDHAGLETHAVLWACEL